MVVCRRCSAIALLANRNASSAVLWPAAAGDVRRSIPARILPGHGRAAKTAAPAVSRSISGSPGMAASCSSSHASYPAASGPSPAASWPTVAVASSSIDSSTPARCDPGPAGGAIVIGTLYAGSQVVASPYARRALIRRRLLLRIPQDKLNYAGIGIRAVGVRAALDGQVHPRQLGVRPRQRDSLRGGAIKPDRLGELDRLPAPHPPRVTGLIE